MFRERKRSFFIIIGSVLFLIEKPGDEIGVVCVNPYVVADAVHSR